MAVKQQTVADRVNTAADPEGWQQALDEHLLDVDTFGDWLAGHLCHRGDAKPEAVRKLAGLLSLGRVADAAPFSVAELTVVLMTETPDVATRARFVLRERYLAEQSEAVARIYWARQDGDEEAARDSLRDFDDTTPADVGCEFDGTVTQ